MRHSWSILTLVWCGLIWILILKSPEVTKGQIWRSVILLLRKCVIISGPIIGNRPRKKGLDSPSKPLSPACHQIWPNFNGLGYRGQENQNIVFFAKNGFSQITLELRKLVTHFWQHCVPLAETHRNMYILTLKCQFQNLTLGQGHVKTPSRSYCISVEASVREKHIGTIPSALSLFYQMLETKKNECALIWLRMTRRRGHLVTNAYGSSRVA